MCRPRGHRGSRQGAQPVKNSDEKSQKQRHGMVILLSSIFTLPTSPSFIFNQRRRSHNLRRFFDLFSCPIASGWLQPPAPYFCAGCRRHWICVMGLPAARELSDRSLLRNHSTVASPLRLVIVLA